MRWELLIELLMITIQRTYPWLVGESIITMMRDTIRMSHYNLLLWAASLSTAIVYFIAFAENWWWEPFFTIPIMIGIYTVDMIFAVVLTGRVKGMNWEFNSTKFNKYIVDVIGVMMILGLMHAFPVIGKLMMEHDDAIEPIKRDMTYNGLIITTWGGYLAIATRQGLSAIANAAKAGIIPAGAGRLISKHIDTYKDSIFNNKDGERY